jgi:hypothetical protein
VNECKPLLRGMLHHLNPTTLLRLLQCHELWVPNEATRFRLAREVLRRMKAEAAEERAAAEECKYGAMPSPPTKEKKAKKAKTSSSGGGAKKLASSSAAAAAGTAAAVDETAEGIARVLLGEMVSTAAAGSGETGETVAAEEEEYTDDDDHADAEDDDEQEEPEEGEEEEEEEDLVLAGAKVLSQCINYPHLPFGELLNIRTEIEVGGCTSRIQLTRSLESARFRFQPLNL